MTQHGKVTIDPTVTNGSQLAANINGWRKAALTLHSGVERPSYASAGTMWISTGSSPWKLCVYDGTDDVVIGELKPDSHDFVSAGGTDYTNDLMTAGNAAEARNKLGAVAKSGDVITGWLKVEFNDANLAELRATGETDARLTMRSNNGNNSYVEFGQRQGGDAYIWSRGTGYNFRNDGRLQADAGWSVHGDGNISGSIWNNWGSSYAYSAISNRIEDRANAYANNKAPSGAECQHNSGTVEFAWIPVDSNRSGTTDLPNPYVMTGVRGNGRGFHPRGKTIRNR